MFFLDRSPGAFIALATLVVYGVVCAEIWMWTVASVAAVAVTLALIAVCAVLICRAVLQLMDDGTTAVAPESQAAELMPVTAAAVPPVAAPVRPRAARVAGRIAPTA